MIKHDLYQSETNDAIKQLYREIAGGDVNKFCDIFTSKKRGQEGPGSSTTVIKKGAYMSLDSDSEEEQEYAEPQYKVSLQQQIKELEHKLEKFQEEKKKVDKIVEKVAKITGKSVKDILDNPDLLEEFLKESNSVGSKRSNLPDESPSPERKVARNTATSPLGPIRDSGDAHLKRAEKSSLGNEEHLT